MKDLLRILGLWRRQAGWLIGGMLVSLAAVAAGAAVMSIAGHVIGAAVALGVLAAPLALDVSGAARVVLRYTERLITHNATFRALADLRVWFFRGLSRSAAGGLGFRQAGDVLARLVGDVEALDGLYLRILVPLVGALLLLVALIVLIHFESWPAAVAVALAFAAAAFGLPWVAARAALSSGARLASASAQLRIAAVDALSGLREVRAFAAEGRVLALVQSREGALMTAQRELVRRTAFASAAALLCGQAAILVVLVVAGVNPVVAVSAVFLVVAAFEMAGGLPRAGVLAGHAAAAASRVLEAAEAPAPVIDPARPAVAPIRSGLRFEGVHFRWRPDAPAVFEGLTLDVPEGARVGLLGPSGSGKSTLAALALKLAAPQQGRVMLGGADVATLTAEAVRERIGWLGQATHLFDDTIRNNLLLARPEADEAALWAALEAARVADLVRSLPDRLDSWAGEGGTRFSGGEGRRIALARALLSPAPVLILDEPCAGLDGETERAFLTTLNEAVEGRSVVLITHRLTGVERLDRIWRLSGGHAVAAAG
jgi:ATP-binding cassette subfamily C protein CydC